MRIASRLETILPKVEAQVVAASGLDPTLVFSSLLPDARLMDIAPTASFAVLRPKQFRIWEGAVAGGGNDVLWVDGTFDLVLYNRYAADVDWGDDLRLTDATSGVLIAWSNVIHSLQLFDPVDGSGNQLCAEPIRIAAEGWWWEWTEPTTDWLRLVSRWELKYTHLV